MKYPAEILAERSKAWKDILRPSGKGNQMTVLPAPLTLVQLKKRLADLKQHLLNEQHSSKPSQRYIDDLKLSIPQAEHDIASYTGQYQILKS